MKWIRFLNIFSRPIGRQNTVCLLLAPKPPNQQQHRCVCISHSPCRSQWPPGSTACWTTWRKPRRWRFSSSGHWSTAAEDTHRRKPVTSAWGVLAQGIFQRVTDRINGEQERRPARKVSQRGRGRMKKLVNLSDTAERAHLWLQA